MYQTVTSGGIITLSQQYSIQQYLCGYRVFSFQQIFLVSFASPPTFPLHLSRCTLDQERPLFLTQSQLAGLEDVR